MEINQPLDSDSRSDLNISHSSVSDLSTTAFWAKFISIVSFIFLGFAVLGVFGIGAVFATMGDEMGMPAAMGTGMVVFYLIILVMAFVPALYLFRFSNKLKVATQFNNQQDLDTAFSNLKSYFKFIGIFMAVAIGLNVLFALLMPLLGFAFM